MIKAGTGSNADLNFILISMLKDLAIDAYPVVLSRRSTGMLPFSFPSLQKLNTFVVAIYDADTQKYIYLDSSMDFPAFNVLPLDLCVNRARILSPREPEEKKWVDLMNLRNNGVFMNINASIQDGKIKGHRQTQLQGQQAIEYREYLGNRRQEKKVEKPDSLTFSPESVNKDRVTVSNLKTMNVENDFAQIREDFDFIIEPDQAGDRLYINPMLFQHLNKNPFIQAERILPVEFRYPYRFTLSCALTLPEDYEIEELPRSYSVRTESGNLQCKYMLQQEGNKVMLNYMFLLRTHLFAPDQYQQLQEIWTKAIEKNQALMVLKIRPATGHKTL